MKIIHFIINPISGSGGNRISEALIHEFFSKEEFDISVFYTQYKNHATELTHKSVKAGAAVIVASGGDGTINEIASCLVGKNIPLGIIPGGSGNGLASNLKIPLVVRDALALIKKNKITKIDVGTVGGNYFFSNSGIGFDAQVIKNYEISNERTIVSYIKSSLKALKEFNSNDIFKVSVNGEVLKCKPFMVFVSNSNELGYNLSLTPEASLKDGFFDVLVVSEMNKFKILLFGFLMLFKNHQNLKEVQFFRTKKIVIKNLSKLSTIDYQLDGEVRKSERSVIEYFIQEKSLFVIC